MRSIAAFLVLLVAGLMIPAATAGWWLRDTVMPRSAYVDTVAPLAADPDVQDAVRATLVKEAVDSLGGTSRPVAVAVEPLVRRATAVLVEGPVFQRAWTESNRAVHKELVAALTGDSEALGRGAGSTVELRLEPLTAAVRDEVEKAGIPLGEAIPRIDTTYPLGTVEDLGRAQTAFALLDDYGRALPAAAALLMVIGLALARRFGVALAGTAAVALLGLGALWLAVAAGRSGYLAALPPGVPPAAGGAYFDLVTAPLRDLVGYVAIGSAAALVVGLVAAGGRRSA